MQDPQVSHTKRTAVDRRCGRSRRNFQTIIKKGGLKKKVLNGDENELHFQLQIKGGAGGSDFLITTSSPETLGRPNVEKVPSTGEGRKISRKNNNYGEK